MLLNCGQHGQHQAAEDQQKSAIAAWRGLECCTDRTAEEPLAGGCGVAGGFGKNYLEGRIRMRVPWSCGSVLDTKGRSPKVWATELTDTLQASQFPSMRGLQPGEVVIPLGGGRSLWAGGGNTPAQAPTVRKRLQAQPFASGALGFKTVLREVSQRSAGGPGTVGS